MTRNERKTLVEIYHKVCKIGNDAIKADTTLDPRDLDKTFDRQSIKCHRHISMMLSRGQSHE